MLLPTGYPQLFPYIFCADAPRYIDFLRRAFGAVEAHRTTAAGGRIANAQLRIDSAAFMLSEAVDAFPPMPASYYLFVDDADAAVARALAAGATLVMPVADMPYQDRQGGVRDPAGTLWWISQRLVDGPYAT